VVFRRVYDHIQASHAGIAGDVEYLRILHLAASTMEADVAAALAILESSREAITIEGVKSLVTAAPVSIDVPVLRAAFIDLDAYTPRCPRSRRSRSDDHDQYAHPVQARRTDADQERTDHHAHSMPQPQIRSPDDNYPEQIQEPRSRNQGIRWGDVVVAAGSL
jgi:hypothetical protein